MAKTLFEKVWERNLVTQETDERPAILHISLHLVHEVTSPQAFTVLRERGVKVRRPDLTLATIDHSVPTLPAGPSGELPYVTDAARNQVETLRKNCAEHGVPLLDLGDDRRGIVHVVGPELGRTRPGMTVVCGDSHTSTHGAFGALAFGIGTTEVGHVLATQSLLQRRPKTMRVNFVGTPSDTVTGKDLALAMIAKIGTQGGTGYVLEYTGESIRALSMEGRMTLCNMSIEAGARAGMIAPDETTWSYLDGAAGESVSRDDNLFTDEDAIFDAEIEIDASAVKPMVTFGTAPDAAIAASASVPAGVEGIDYMDLEEGQELTSVAVTTVFVGSCTNGRLEDLRAVGKVLGGRKVADGVKMLIVPGSEQVKRDAESEGLHSLFLEAGAEWREPGCSMCIAMNGDRGQPGDLVVSTSNRNFKGRQGEGVRTVLASPLTAAASAVAGHIADPGEYL
ncbi:MAG: 3-isopropylmalate dehydratase large subunit [Parvularculaceae bacterium]|nr:3-isopropylmalate dehydratase large subunit [Parvularculaceae bacterium]